MLYWDIFIILYGYIYNNLLSNSRLCVDVVTVIYIQHFTFECTYMQNTIHYLALKSQFL